MPTVDPDKLPYPLPPGMPAMANTRRGGRRLHIAPVPGAIVAGSAQCPEAYLRPGGRFRDSEGVLGFFEDGFLFYADSGRDRRVDYGQIKSYSVKRGGLMTWRRGFGFMQELTLNGVDGTTVRFRIGRDLAANADYILSAKEVHRNEGI